MKKMRTSRGKDHRHPWLHGFFKRLFFWRQGNRRLGSRLIAKEISSQKKGQSLSSAIDVLSRHGFRVIRGVLVGSFFLGLVFFFFRGWHFLSTSSSFSVKEVVITTRSQKLQKKIKEYTTKCIGENIFKIQVADLKQELSKIPEVLKIRIKRQLPSVLVIDIVEAIPSIAVDIDGLYLVGQEGVPYKRISREENEDYKVVTGIERSFYEAHPLDAQALIREADVFLKKYEQWAKKYWPHPSEIRVVFRKGAGARLDSFVISTIEGSTIWFDAETRERSERSLATFAIAYEEIRKKEERPLTLLVNNKTHPDWVIVRKFADFVP